MNRKLFARVVLAVAAEVVICMCAHAFGVDLAGAGFGWSMVVAHLGLGAFALVTWAAVEVVGH